MKNFLFFLIIVLMCSSCNNNMIVEQDEPCFPVGGVLPPPPMAIILIDEDGKDRLNPKSPAYFGDEFVKGIRVLGFNRKYLNPVCCPRHNCDCIMYWPIRPPFIWVEGHGYVGQGNNGFYTIVLGGTAGEDEDGESYAFMYICYPDGSEDMIRFRIGKVLVNSELAMDMKLGSGVKEDLWHRYYNPKYFLELVPVFNGDGKQIGIMPKNGGTLLIVITK